MKKILAGFLLFLSLSGCCNTTKSNMVNPIPRQSLFDQVLDTPRIFSQQGALIGHMCPVGPERAFTAGHVARRVGPIFTWGIKSPTNHGKIISIKGGGDDDENDDLAIVVSTPDVDENGIVPPFPRWFPISKKEPTTGEELTIFIELGNSDLARSQGRFIGRHPEQAKFRIVDIMVWPGSSGSCVLNASGEVVGIVSASIGKPNFPSVMSYRSIVGE